MKLKKLYSLDFVKRFEILLENDFERELYRASLRNYASHGNPLRFHNFAFSLRSLIDHIILRKSPDNEVKKAPWYTKDHEHYDVSRRQRLKYCSQMKISDEYLGKDFLEQSNEEISYMLKLYSSLNSYTHINQKSLKPNPIRFFEDAKDILKTASNILNGLEECKSELINTMEEKIRDAVFDMAANSAPEELITIANHASIEYVDIEEFGINKIDDEYIYIYAKGNASVTQEYGPKNDSATIDEEYPFTLNMISHLSHPETFEVTSEALEVDTTSWYGCGDEEDETSVMSQELSPSKVPNLTPAIYQDDDMPF
ncbi:hypothetical protein ACRQ84_12535 [Enterobacter ludwigii]